MSKELEALKRIRQETCPATYMQDFDKEECLQVIEKSLKALEIIKNKECDMRWLKYCIKEYKTVEVYNNGLPEHYEKLTEEEFDLLKEVLGC